MDEKAMYVEQVKTFQRTSASHKETWWKYCRDIGSANFDPNRHEASTLMDFLTKASAGLLEMVPAGSEGGGGRGGGGWGGWGGGGGGGGGEVDPDKAEYVNQVKAWQRTSAAHKETWWKYCRDIGSAKYDPNKHDAATLMDFLAKANGGLLEMVKEQDFQGSDGKGGSGGGWGSSWSSGGDSWGGDSWGGWGQKASAGGGEKYSPEIEAKLDQWVELKRAKDFLSADKLRDELRAAGVADPNAARPDPRGGGKGKGSFGKVDPWAMMAMMMGEGGGSWGDSWGPY